MVVDMIYDLLDTRWYMALTGVILTFAGLAGVMNPDTWFLASEPFGQLFNVLPNIVHQAIGALVALGGVSQVVDVLQ